MEDSSEMPIGKRPLPVLIDNYASETAERAYTYIPKNDDDLSQGFEKISYKQLANAVNHAA